jgi:hypothetical protein
MAVRTQQDALARFLAGSGERTRDALATQGERLRGGVDVMELQRSHALGEAAERARSSGFLDQDPLELASPGHHPRGLATGAAEAVRPAHVARRTVIGTYELQLAQALAVRRGDGGTSPARAGLEAVAA